MKKLLFAFCLMGITLLGIMAFSTVKKETSSGSFQADEDGYRFIAKDSKLDNLLTANNCVLTVIDYQQEMLGVVYSIDQDLLTNNMQGIVKTAQNFEVPIIHSTVGVNLGFNKTTISTVADLMKEIPVIDRKSLNGWQNQDFIDAIKATGRKKILITGLWTSGCPTYTTLDALAAGFEVYIISDAMGDGTSDAHERAMQRMIQAGAKPVTWEAVLAEMIRVYDNPKTSGAVKVMTEHFYPTLGK